MITRNKKYFGMFIITGVSMAIAYKSLSVNSLLDNNLTRQTIFNLNHCSEVSQLLAYPIKMAPEKPSGHMNGFKGVADLSLDVIDANDKRGKVHLIAIRPPGKLDWVSQYLKITIDGKDFIVENISNPSSVNANSRFRIVI